MCIYNPGKALVNIFSLKNKTKEDKKICTGKVKAIAYKRLCTNYITQRKFV